MPAEPVSDDVTAAIFRTTGGNFRLISRTLTQVQRILEINGCSNSRRKSSKRHARAS